MRTKRELNVRRGPRALPRPSRVLMTADTVGGVWHYALDLSKGLAQLGVDVTIAAMGGRLSASQREDARGTSGVQVVDSDFRLEWMTDPWQDVEAAGEWLLDVASDVKADVVHLNNYVHGTLPWRRPVIMAGHSCVYSWFESVRRSDPGDEWHEYRRRVACGLSAADFVTAPTQAMLASLKRHYGEIVDGYAIYNGVSARKFAPARKEPLILGAGRVWDEAKNLSALDDVAAELDWPVYVAGSMDHPDGGSLAFKRAVSLGLLSRDEMKRWMARAEIYALPARYEPFGLSAVEAALSGCALVLGDIPTLREVWGDAAVFVDPDDRGALRDALALLIEHQDLRAVLARRAARRARTFTVERMVHAYAAVYARVPKVGASAGVHRERERLTTRVGLPAPISQG